MTRDQVLDDLKYVKTIAEQGAHAPLVGGRIGLMWGVLICLTFFMQWAILSRTLPLAAVSLLYLWIGFATIGGLGTLILGQQTNRKPGAQSVANQVETHVWVMFSGMMATLFVGIVLNQMLSNGSAQLFDLMVIIGFAGQGLAYGVIAKVSQIRWIHLASLASFIASAVSFTAYGQVTIYLIGSIAIIFTVILPSLVSMKDEPKNVI